MSTRTRSRILFGLVLGMVIVYVALRRAESIPTWTLTLLVGGLVVTSVATDLLLCGSRPR